MMPYWSHDLAGVVKPWFVSRSLTLGRITCERFSAADQRGVTCPAGSAATIDCHVAEGCGKKRPSVYSAKGHVCARRSGCLRWVEGSKVSVGKEKNFFDELVIFSACVQICARSFVDFVRVCLVFDHEVILGSWFKVPGSRF